MKTIQINTSFFFLSFHFNKYLLIHTEFFEGVDRRKYKVERIRHEEAVIRLQKKANKFFPLRETLNVDDKRMYKKSLYNHHYIDKYEELKKKKKHRSEFVENDIFFLLYKVKGILARCISCWQKKITDAYRRKYIRERNKEMHSFKNINFRFISTDLLS